MSQFRDLHKKIDAVMVAQIAIMDTHTQLKAMFTKKRNKKVT